MTPNREIWKERYRLLYLLGRGGQGETYLAEDLQADHALLALKILDGNSGGPRSEGEFLRECRMLQRLRHINIARVCDFGRDGDHLFYATEYVEGGNFVSESVSKDWNAVFRFIVQACWALGYLHQQGIVHRDIKPQNLLVGRLHDGNPNNFFDRGMVRVIDFGLASWLDKLSFDENPVGTPSYMAPEIWHGEKYDHRADIYSLGLVLFELAWGKLPSGNGTISDFLEKRMGVRDLSSLSRWGVPPGVIEIIRRTIDPDPGKRLSDAREAIQILNRLEGEKFHLDATDGPPSVTAPPLRRLAKRRALKENVLNDGLCESILVELKALSRAGRKAEALELCRRISLQVRRWDRAQPVDEFFAVFLHLLAEAGEISEAKSSLREFGLHPAFNNQKTFEYFLASIHLSLRVGDINSASRSLESIPPNLRHAAERSQEARLENYTGWIQKAEGKWAEASGSFERAADLAALAGREDLKASFLANSGSNYFEQGRWKYAYQKFQDALAIAETLENRSLLATILNNLGNLYLYFGRWGEADTALRESLSLAEECQNKSLIAYNHYLLTVAEEGAGNFESAKSGLERAILASKELGDPESLLQAILALGYHEMGAGNLKKSRGLLNDLRRRSKNAGNAGYIFQADWLELKLGLVSGAATRGLKKLMAIVVAAAEKMGNPMVLWQVYFDEGNLEKQLGNLKGSRTKYEKAHSILQNISLEVPEVYRNSFFRDRKKAGLLKAIQELKSGSPSPVESAGPFLAASFRFTDWVDLNRRILQQHRVDEVLQEILEAALRLSGAERGFVILVEEGSPKIRAARNIGIEALSQKDMRFSATVVAEVMRSGKSQIILDAESDERFSPADSVKAMKLRSLLCVPLCAAGKSEGLVYLDNRLRHGVFQEDHRTLIEALADQASLALEHARLNEENLRAIEDLRKSKKVIEKLNVRLEEKLEVTSESLMAAQESLRRQNQETSLRYQYGNIVGQSPKIRDLLRVIDRVVESNINVFIFGESGTGKELIAQAIHYNGPRKENPFISENCAAIPENLMESELFGHVRGAFTGAERNKVGLFQMADGGTLFLDEVGEMSPALQAKLLRALQEQMIRPVGSNRYSKVNVRVISASNKNLRELVAKKKFRQDLYYRINVMQINLPPLRDRREDIPLLVERFIEMECPEKSRPRVGKEALKTMMDYGWPGNIR
ncbi:MAG: sigma 54-interacting transcriptional regulator, partial [Deltaproteobacteria bacterium]|nr:sigma 54-interacting transcriptional regulator [Deltaproteobacteria bacterium]